MTPNVCFALLDQAVIAGHGDDPVVEEMTHARLLEESAALAGVLRHLGLRRAMPAVIDLESDLDAVVAALAVARVGAMVTTADHRSAPVAMVSSGSGVLATGRVRIVRGADVAEPDLEWDAMIRAGRTDPAACEALTPESAYSRERTVAEQIAVLGETRAPYDVGLLRSLLQV